MFIFLKENRIHINVGKGEIAFNEHEQFLLSHYVCRVFKSHVCQNVRLLAISSG